MGTTVVIEDVMASELPEAWRQRVKAKGNEVLTVTITKRKMETAAKTAKKPNASFGMWADRGPKKTHAKRLLRDRASVQGEAASARFR